MPHSKHIEKVREMEDEAIHKDLAKLREEYFMRRFSADPKRIENPGRYREIRRTIARYLTVLKERNVQRQQAPQGE